jgi:hypothetical protein
MAQYEVKPMSASGLEPFRVWVFAELSEISKAFNGVQQPILPMLYKPPTKLVDGMIVLADGTRWNPGSGGGFYGYRAGAWRFLG